MILRCTKKLFNKLPNKDKASEQAMPAIGTQSQWLNWHANLITIQRRQCVIALRQDYYNMSTALAGSVGGSIRTIRKNPTQGWLNVAL